jgi:uncharacterized membrane protein
MRAYPWRISHFTTAWLLLLLVVLSGRPGFAAAAPVSAPSAPGSPVRAVLFYSPTCPHCHVVIDDVLPPLREEYGRDLVIAELNATTVEGQQVWQEAVALYNPPVVGFPTLVIGEYVLIGSREIPEALPGLIASYRAAGGVDWPPIPGLEAMVATLEPARSETGMAQVWARFQRDLVGNTLSLVVLSGLVAVFIAVIRPRGWQKEWSERIGSWLLLPLVVGLGVSLYLAYVETSGSSAVCGPVGDCNAVQQSPFALLFGRLPVAVLGVMGYVALLATYGLWLLTASPFRRYLPGLMFSMALFGLGFATYLTFLEPFVIGATCAWCLTQAVCMLIVALLTAGPGWDSLRDMGREMGLVRASG